MVFGLFTPRVDRGCLRTGGEKTSRILNQSLDLGCSLFELGRDEFAETVRRSVDCQFMVVAMTIAVCNYTLQDAYHDAGLAGPLAGMPKFKFDRALDGRTMAHQAWADFPPCKADLDMRYQYIFSARLLSGPEAGLWGKCENWAEAAAKAKFEYKKQLSPDWIGFVSDLRNADVASATQRLMELPI